jgi:hypothetical protein
MATGLALQNYLQVIERAKTDSAKYSKELLESYRYIASYHTLVTKDLKTAKIYWKMVLAIEPNDPQAGSMLKRPEFKNIP